MPGDRLDALDVQEAWEVVVDALFDEILTHVEEHRVSPTEALRARLHARGRFARAEVTRRSFEELSRRLDARGFAIVRTR